MELYVNWIILEDFKEEAMERTVVDVSEQLLVLH
jgi:hypothetical protein